LTQKEGTTVGRAAKKRGNVDKAGGWGSEKKRGGGKRGAKRTEEENLKRRGYQLHPGEGGKVESGLNREEGSWIRKRPHAGEGGQSLHAP